MDSRTRSEFAGLLRTHGAATMIPETRLMTDVKDETMGLIYSYRKKSIGARSWNRDVHPTGLLLLIQAEGQVLPRTLLGLRVIVSPVAHEHPVSQIAILVCSSLALQICKLAAKLTRQECKCATSLQQVNASFEVTTRRTCCKLAT
ncbi:hypothetical protein AVEN_169468-1 [Araneus ventricosus]|uniref:Uncharacterized protein n=1 Tax=Araneus ventricosus TaxID=182803 RepID=A0A4Y2PZA7_ARAVE|nr:hypothetical protein AVEN_169468-1 [Araneus ventricosus]